MKTHRFVGQRHLASYDAALILAFGLPLAALEACSDGDSSKAPEGKASHTERGGQLGEGWSEGGDSSTENKSPPGRATSNGEQSADKSDGTMASDGSSGGASTTPSDSSTGDGSTPEGGKAAGAGAPSLNSPTKMKGWKAGQANGGRVLSRSKKSCPLSTGRQQAEGVQSDEHKITEDTVNHHLVELQQGKPNFHTEPSDRTKLRGANGAEVDGVADVVTYADTGGKSYRGWHWLRMFSTSAPAMYVLVNYMYPASAHSGSELMKIIKKSSLSIDGDVPGGIVN